MAKKILLLALFLFFPLLTAAQTTTEQAPPTDKVFKAEVIQVVGSKTMSRENGSTVTQQNLLLKGLEKEWKNKEMTYYGISDIDNAGANIYKVGDKVLVSEVKNIDGENDYFVVDFVRSNYLIALAVIFCLVIIIIGKEKGVKSLLSLAVSFLIIIGFIIPRILSGNSPLLIGVIGSVIILGLMIYITDGFNLQSHLSVLSVFFSMLATFILSWVFTGLTRLTGMAQEESVFLLGANNGNIDFKGLLLAGIMIGTVGVLDDVIVGQIELVKQIRLANPKMSNTEIYKSAFKVGNSHLGAIVNTLFLTYAGASLPLLLLFYITPNNSTSFFQVINNEMIATEIVRTLVGSIGVALSIPISTFLATVWLKDEKVI